MARDPAGCPARPDQFERREQPPALVAPQDAARDQLPGHRRRIQPLAAKAARDPEAFAQLTDLRHAMHGQADGAAEDIGYRDLAELRKSRGDAARNRRAETARPRV